MKNDNIQYWERDSEMYLTGQHRDWYILLKSQFGKYIKNLIQTL